MAPYWVYHDRSVRRAKVHHSACCHCNNGRGNLTRPRVPGGPDVWFAFDTLEEALEQLRGLDYADKGPCKSCLPDVISDKAPLAQMAVNH